MNKANYQFRPGQKIFIWYASRLSILCPAWVLSPGTYIENIWSTNGQGKVGQPSEALRHFSLTQKLGTQTKKDISWMRLKSKSGYSSAPLQMKREKASSEWEEYFEPWHSDFFWFLWRDLLLSISNYFYTSHLTVLKKIQLSFFSYEIINTAYLQCLVNMWTPSQAGEESWREKAKEIRNREGPR